MAKRFTETGIWDDQWYQDLPVVYKLAWRYICDKCDIAGVWKVNKRLLDFQVGEVIPLTECIKLFNHEKERIIVVNSYWVLADFIRFQYGTLNDKVPFHRKIKESLDRLDSTLYTRLQNRLLSSLKAKEEEEDKVKDKDGIQGGVGGKAGCGIPQEGAAAAQEGAVKSQEPALNGTELNGMELSERERLEPWSTWLDKLKATGKVPDSMKPETLGDYCARVGCWDLAPHLDALIHDLEGATGIVGSVTWWTKHLTDIMHPPEQRSQRSNSTVRRKGDPDYVEYR